MNKNGFRDLRIYTISVSLVSVMFNLCKNHQIQREYAITSQLKRAVISVPLNIAEGYGRKTKKDFAQFLSIALGSCNEINALLDCMEDITKVDLRNIKLSYESLGKQIYTFRESLKGD